MPITPIAGQVGPNGTQPFSTQSTLGQVIGEANFYNPSMSSSMVINFINNVVRDYYDRRMWYGLMRRGILIAPGYYSTGSINLTYGSTSVQGVGTGWTSTLGGQPITQQQLRVGFTAPPYNITALDQANQILTLDLPWGNGSISSSGYFVTQMWYPIPNIKYMVIMKNLTMMYRIWTNVNQQLLDNWDPSRLQLMFPRVFASCPPDSSGNFVGELWPAPNVQQGFPWIGYCQPDNLTLDGDIFPPFMRIDVVKARVIADVLRFRPKMNPAYSESAALAVAEQKMREYEAGVMTASQADEALWRADTTLAAEQMPMANLDFGTGFLQGGAYAAAMQPYSADY